ncbi:MAG: TetR family transcriptional regulator [Ilumatobacteraceae bacterium]|nr:TetR family transcriptional regulator [Ilumatobacteraceae bacterium]
MATDTKQKMIHAAAGLMRRKGLTGMSFTDVTETAGVPRGVIYHHFPAGKEQLASDAVECTGTAVLEQLRTLDATTSIGLVDQFLNAIRPVVVESAHGAGCAVASVIVESSLANTPLTTTANTALKSWIDELSNKLTERGTDPAVAGDIAAMLITALEGAHILARASGDLDAFERSVRFIRAGTTAMLESTHDRPRTRNSRP